MATSAFRSTTRRGYQTGGSGSTTENGGVSSTPQSWRDPSPSPRGRDFHRRSSSMTDFSARYFSDCSSTLDSRSSFEGSRAGRSSVCPSDSESDMDAASEHERPTVSSDAISATKSDRKGLRRTSSGRDFSQNSSKMNHQVPILDEKSAVDDREDLAEEKTIRAVYAQMKSLGSDPPVGDIGMHDFLDAMRTEIRRAVSDIRMELEEAIQKNGKLASNVNAQGSSECKAMDVIQAVADIQKEYMTKLEESEKRVRELWSQIAVEERRYLELSKIVKELLPMPPLVSTSTSSSRRRPSRRKNSAEIQLDSKSLDEDALRYLEECVSISSYDCQGESDDSAQDKGGSGRPQFGQPLSKKKDCKRETQQQKSSLMGSDGVVLPWLQWEAEGFGNSKETMKQERSLDRRMSDKSVTQFQNSDHTPPSSTARKLAAANRAAKQTTSQPSSRSEIGAACNVWELQPKAYRSGLSSLFTVDDCNLVVAQSEGPLEDVDTLLLEKIKLRCRVENRELLLCRGLFLM